MAGIYIHIPYCRQACSYCDFHFSTLFKGLSEFDDFLLKEAKLRREELSGKEINSLYFGGGTPSLLSPEQISRIAGEMSKLFFISDDAEITLEANPDDVDSEKVKSWMKAGINRLSIGVQSFFDDELALLNRAHDASEAEYSIKSAQDAGIENINLDLIFGIPGSNASRWKSSLKQGVELSVPHMSVYGLAIEEKTLLKHQIEKGDLNPASDEFYFDSFLYADEYLGLSGFEHYEISNYALAGQHARHNSSYWKGSEYLGLGPSAHSFDFEQRSWNVRNNAEYFRRISKNESPVEEREVLGEAERMNEYLMTSLRIASGIDLVNFKDLYGEEAIDQISEQSERFISSGDLERIGDRLRATLPGWYRLDHILTHLFFE